VDTISEVLAFPDMAQEAPPQPAAQPEQAAQPDGTLTNNDIIKMARVKLGDSIIIAKIKASPCNFDTSVDALVKLKEAGVSDAVIQAMQDASAPQATGGDSTGAPPNPTPAGPSTFPVRHRHRSYDVQNWKAVDSYCSGSLSVFPDGKVAYDCSQADDQGNRCEHVSFAAGALKQAKIGSGGSLHIESKTQGKFDFFGDQNDIQQALAAIAPLVQTTQK